MNQDRHEYMKEGVHEDVKEDNELGERRHKFSIERALMGIGGVICPVPIIGECLLSAPIYTGINRVSPNISRGMAIGVSVTSATIARAGFYAGVYLPMMEYILKN